MTPPDSATITCIYCRQVREPTREHVLQRSLGGDLVRPIVCKDCNTRRLSPLDQALAERSLISLSRVGFTPGTAFDVRLGGDHFVNDEESGLVLDVAVVNEMRAVVMPQVHLLGRGEQMRLSILVADADALVSLDAFLVKQIDSDRLPKMHIKLGPSDAGPSARLVMHREKEGYVRAQTEEDAQRLIELLLKGWKTTYKPSAMAASGENASNERSMPNTDVRLHMSFRPDDMNRAVAKIALNVVAARVGPDFALAPEFDDLRRYILGDDIRHPEYVAPNEILVDPRFVLPLPYGERPLMPTDDHAVTITYVPPTLYAWVTLYKSHNFIVALGSIALTESLFEVHEFSSIRRGNEALDVLEIYKRIRARG